MIYFCVMNKDRHIDIMAIVNLTDDSFYGESRCRGLSQVLDRVSSMIEEGADIIDFGACSTRPGSVPVGESVEWERLEPVLKAVRDSFPAVTLSIDTYWSSVVRKAYDLVGPFIVNDISAGQADSRMLPVVGELGLRYVAMHMRGSHQTMQQFTDYDDVTESVLQYFCEFAIRAEENGITEWILDPGFGFSKTLEQNYQLLRELPRLKTIVRADGQTPPLLVGVSRKSMIYNLLGISPEEALAPTQVAHIVALQNGADILRVHDVSETVRTVMQHRVMSR